jgi:hypothetical protein
MPRVPQEIIQGIYDIMAQDIAHDVNTGSDPETRILAPYAVVSRTFADAARRRLFETVTLDTVPRAIESTAVECIFDVIRPPSVHPVQQDS